MLGAGVWWVRGWDVLGGRHVPATKPAYPGPLSPPTPTHACRGRTSETAPSMHHAPSWGTQRGVSGMAHADARMAALSSVRLEGGRLGASRVGGGGVVGEGVQGRAAVPVSRLVLARPRRPPVLRPAPASAPPSFHPGSPAKRAHASVAQPGQGGDGHLEVAVQGGSRAGAGLEPVHRALQVVQNLGAGARGRLWARGCGWGPNQARRRAPASPLRARPAAARLGLARPSSRPPTLPPLPALNGLRQWDRAYTAHSHT